MMTPPLLAAHMACSFAGAVENAPRIHGEHLLPGAIGCLEDRDAREDPGIVHPYIDPSGLFGGSGRPGAD